MRARWIAAAAALGAAAGLALAALHASSYRQTVSFIVAPALRTTEPSLSTMTKTAAELVQSRIVAENVVNALHLQESPGRLRSELSAHKRSGTAIVDVTVTRPSAVEAQRVAQQVLTTFQGLANSRLGHPGGGVAVAVWDPPSGGVQKEGRPFAAYGVAGASLGLLASLVAALALGRGPAAARVPAAAPERAPAPVPEPASTPERPPQPKRAREPEPPSNPVPKAEPPRPAGRVRVADLERIAAAERDPGRAEEMKVYVEHLRSLAAPDGTLGASLEPLVEDVFGTLGPV
jgi:hypothetical protein